MKSRALISILGAAAALFLSAMIFAQSGQRTPDGKPNFSGLWGATGGGGGGGGNNQASVFQGGDAPRQLTRRQRGFGDLPLSEWGKQAFMYHTAADGEYGGETGGVGDPRYHGGVCGGPKSPTDLGNTMQIFQSPELLQITYEGSQPWIRKIWIGRQHPQDITEYVPFWMGHSVGRWEGDTLVVDTVQIKFWQGSAISSNRAAPHSNRLHLVERFEMAPDGRLRIDATYDDPVAYTKTWSETRTLGRRADFEQMAFNWEIAESQSVCDPTGGFWKEDDPWFDNFDKFAAEIIPDLETLKKGMPPLPANAESAQPFLGAFGQVRR